jgi:hypothetical protein
MSSATNMKTSIVEELRRNQQGGLGLNQDRVQAICNSVDRTSNRVGGDHERKATR